jgi:hypothetical protein
MLTTLTTSDLSSVFGGCGKGCQQQQQIVTPPPQVINNYIPAPQQQQQQVVQAAPPPMLPQRKSVAVDIDQVQTA